MIRITPRIIGVALALAVTGGAWWGVGQSRQTRARPAAGGALSTERIARFIRERFGVPANVKLTVGPFRNTFDPQLLEATVTVDDGKQKKDQRVFVSRDGAHLFVGEMYDLGTDPVATALHTISIQNEPSQGASRAPVTIVEYADLQCPLCARLHEFFENDLLKKYDGKVRVVFKDFPLVTIHDWAEKAAQASKCAYQINPEAYVNFRSLVFRNQTGINALNARDMLLNLASQAGINSLRLAQCMDSQALRARVELDLREGQKLGIDSTPTCYVNGRLVKGFPSPEAYYQVIEEALRGSR